MEGEKNMGLILLTKLDQNHENIEVLGNQKISWLFD